MAFTALDAAKGPFTANSPTQPHHQGALRDDQRPERHFQDTRAAPEIDYHRLVATISDVAALAGVSTATVSRVLNGKSTVDTELVSRVREAARALDYRPNTVARNLRRRDSSVLSLVISDVENPFFTAVARGVEDTARAAGYSVLLGNSDEDPDKERAYLELAGQAQTAGVVLSPTGPGTALPEGTPPVVAVDRPLPGGRHDAVLVDTRSAARLATQHLLDQGYQRVACLTGPPGVHTAEDRLAGYREALAGRPELVRRSEFKAAGARQASELLFGERDRPDAVLVANSAMAIGLLETLAQQGLRIGEDVGVVSFDDVPWASLVHPALTVVRQPAHEIGRRAAGLLLDRIGSVRGEAHTVVLAAELVVRGSSTREV